jgi:hypothetical protein
MGDDLRRHGQASHVSTNVHDYEDWRHKYGNVTKPTNGQGCQSILPKILMNTALAQVCFD